MNETITITALSQILIEAHKRIVAEVIVNPPPGGTSIMAASVADVCFAHLADSLDITGLTFNGLDTALAASIESIMDKAARRG